MRPVQADRDAAAADDDARAVACLRSLGWEPLQVRDGAGGVVMRTLAMILNEVAQAVREGVAGADDIDRAMELGTNYPRGPFAWLRALGIGPVWSTLCALMEEFAEDRYRPSPWLRQQWLAGSIERRNDAKEEDACGTL